MRTVHSRIAERDMPVCLLTELRLRPSERRARACLRVSRSYTGTRMARAFT